MEGVAQSRDTIIFEEARRADSTPEGAEEPRRQHGAQTPGTGSRRQARSVALARLCAAPRRRRPPPRDFGFLDDFQEACCLLEDA